VIELADGIWIDAFSVTMVKRISKDKCILWTKGQPGSDGHVLDFPAESVVEVIEDTINGWDEENSEEESED